MQPILVCLQHTKTVANGTRSYRGTIGALFRGYITLLGTVRGQRTYGYVLVNSMFHSGVFTWLGVYFERHDGMSPASVGFALLGYGIPGFLLGPVIGRLADRWGRGRLLPIGLTLSAAAAAMLVVGFPVWLAPGVAILLSLGYDMTQPLFGGIVTSLGGNRPGQAMGLNVFMLFVGFGSGSLIFGAMLRFGFGPALGVFATAELLAAICSLRLFRSEIPSVTTGMSTTHQ
jgi:predicted MFS family arabinose efflux permease